MPNGNRPERELRFTLTRDDGRVDILFTDSKGKFQLTGDLNRDREYTFTIESDGRSFDTTTATLRIIRGTVNYLPVFLRPYSGDGRLVKGVINVAPLEANIPLEARSHYERALKLIEGQQAVEAVTELKAAIKIYPKYLNAMNDLGVLFLKLNRLSEAADSLQAALKVDDGFQMARLNMGVVLNRQNKYHQAAKLLTALYNENPSLAGLRLSLAESLIGDNQLRDAEKVLREAIADPELKAGDQVETHYKLAVVLSRQDRYAEAAKELETAIKLNPSAANAHFLLGAAFLELKRYGEAERELQAAYQLNRAEMGNAQLFLGQLYLAQQRYELAQKALEQYLIDVPNAPNSIQIRQTLEKLKQTPKAEPRPEQE